MDYYNTLSKESEALFKEKGSKFIAYALPVESENAVAEALQKIIEIHPKATHHCTAYKVGLEDPVSRANDDGEPSNSAGKPILGQIESHDILNVLIVVVRYYGGTKLGVGGLQSAYKTAAQLALEANTIVQKVIPVYYSLEFPYDKQGIVDHLLSKINGEILDKAFATACSYQCRFPKAGEIEFTQKLKPERTIVLTKN